MKNHRVIGSTVERMLKSYNSDEEPLCHHLLRWLAEDAEVEGAPGPRRFYSRSSDVVVVVVVVVVAAAAASRYSLFWPAEECS
jgi:hypothetical protein